ncbi:hypothetical protein DRQ33_04850 [bacterium]|nr:MAG: hypothetical protein DRQ33_04850 [bacterium]
MSIFVFTNESRCDYCFVFNKRNDTITLPNIISYLNRGKYFYVNISYPIAFKRINAIRKL